MEQNKELPKRKTPRLQNFDYNIEGAYFITICTQNRKNILSSIVGEGSALPHLSHCGKIVDRWIRELPQKYSEISVDHYVIMPNHIHLILSLHKGNGNGRADPSPTELEGRNSQSHTIISAIAWLKFQATKEIKQIYGDSHEKIFQRSFYDHIIRNYEDYYEIHKYISDNPAQWYFDKFYTSE